MIKIKKGLDLPITGAPLTQFIDTKKTKRVAVIGDDYWWFKPTMAVNVGDSVKKGQLLFTCKRGEGIRFTAPASGKVVEVNRGERRVFQSLVIEVDGDESVSFDNYKGSDLEAYSADDVKNLLVESGSWTSFRTRPYSFISRLDVKPSAIFVTAIDSNPLAIEPTIAINENLEAFNLGVKAISKLAPKTFVCTRPGVNVLSDQADNVSQEEFSGPHPAGNVGTHIHFLNPVSSEKLVWHIGYQDVIAIGKLIETGALYSERIISLAGPIAKKPRIIRTNVGACLCEVTEGEIETDGKARVISGSVFNGRTANSGTPFCYLGKYHNQVTLLREGVEREFFGWHSPGFNKFSVKNIYLSKLIPNKLFSFNTSSNGSDRSMVPIGSFEKVMPLDVIPTYLLRSLLAGDTERAQELGALELDEEDLSLCTFVDPCKHEFGPVLRSNLEKIMKEG